MNAASPRPGSGRYRIMAEINMIPFIDVALVLLIIFMIMTPFLVRSQLKLNLPTAKTANEDIQRNRPLQVQVDKQGVAYMDGQPVPSDLLLARLRQALVDPKHQPIVIEADRDVPFQHVVTVMDAAKSIGAAKLAVTVRKTADGTRRK